MCVGCLNCIAMFLELGDDLHFKKWHCMMQKTLQFLRGMVDSHFHQVPYIYRIKIRRHIFRT
jgi:hypothetical protein